MSVDADAVERALAHLADLAQARRVDVAEAVARRQAREPLGVGLEQGQLERGSERVGEQRLRVEHDPARALRQLGRRLVPSRTNDVPPEHRRRAPERVGVRRLTAGEEQRGRRHRGPEARTKVSSRRE